MRKFFLAYRFHILIFLLAFLVLTSFNFDPDLGWHLAIGEHFLKTGEVIYNDRFSWTMPGFAWGNSYFLYEVITAFLFANCGYLLTVFIFASIGALAFAVVLPKKIDVWILVMTLLAAFLASGNLGIRPHTISILFFAILVRLLFENRFTNLKKLWFWFLFFALWANFHNAFLVGFFVYGSYRFIDLSENFAKSKKLKMGEFILNITVPLTASVFTPYGLNLWKSILNDASFFEMYTSIREWHSLILVDDFRLFYAVSGIIIIWVIHNNFAKMGPKLVFISSLFFILPFLGAYFTFFWAIVFVYAVSRFPGIDVSKKKNSVQKLAVFIPFILLSFLAFNNFVKGYVDLGSLAKALRAGNYPVASADFIKSNNLSQNIFNEYEWGGYLDWRLGDSKVFIDGRMTGWKKNGRPILMDYLAIIDKDCNASKKYGIVTLLLKKGTATVCFEDFKKIYEDESAEVWMKEVKSAQ